MASSRPAPLPSQDEPRGGAGPTLRPARPRRVFLSGRPSRRLKFEVRLKLWLAVLSVPAVALAALFCYRETRSISICLFAAGGIEVSWLLATSILFESIVRPLQTLSNVVAALSEDDFSFRARGARRGDALGDLALEINALAATLQQQRAAALDALTLVEIVMNSMPSPVFAFDGELRLRLLNPAAEKAFHLRRVRAVGVTAAELDLAKLFTEDTSRTVDEAASSGFAPRNLAPGRALHVGAGRWSVYRTTFRLEGVPHTLMVLADVSAALREEERLAWQRLIRVLGHEINNSLTPIKSIAGSLRARLSLATSQQQDSAPDEQQGDRGADGVFEKGLTVIEDRADSLNRFLQAYQRLSRLPTPSLQTLSLRSTLQRAIQLETRLTIEAACAPDVALIADPDQIQQLLINLMRNAADAAFSATGSREPAVELSWYTDATHASIRITDNGDGLLNEANLFVPFYTTKPGGTGIGLVLAQQIAVAHNGSVTLQNRATGQGCVAEVRLPLVPEADAAVS